MHTSHLHKAFAAFLLLLLPLCAFAAQNAIWQDTATNSVVAPPALKLKPGSYRTVQFNKEALLALLARAPMEFSGAAKFNVVEMTIPMPNGTFARFRIEKSPVSAPDPTGKVSEFEAYSGQGIDDPTATMRCDFSPAGFHAQILSVGETVYVDPYSANDTAHCVVYYKRDAQRNGAVSDCLTPSDSDAARFARQARLRPNVANGATLRTFRLAVAVTGEYTAFFRLAGDTDAQAKTRALNAIKASINRVTGIYQRDLAIRLLLRPDATELAIIYTNGGTDPYTNDNTDNLITQNQTNLDAVVGNANYDIGHVFATSPGGLASAGVCVAGGKAMGATGTDAPVNDAFNVDFVAHEIGHQFNGSHTFNAGEAGGNCSAANREPAAAYEPASGSTILAYAGTCDVSNLQANSDDYFHTFTVDQIVDYVTNGDATCAALTATGNTPPTVTAPPTRTIPKNTPFTLTATASDPNGDALTYCWEEFDLGAASPPNSDDGTRPLFRSYKPVASPSRTFPSLKYILNNANTPPATYVSGAQTFVTGEVMPVTTRAMKFRVTVRDNRAGGGGINSALAQVNVRADSGPFVVTSPNTAVTAGGGNAFTVTWNVANTTATPVSAANVKISLSTDGGNTFPTVLLASTPNDGSQVVTLPDTASTTARIKVEAVGNIFFDVSNTNFTIQGRAATTNGAAGRGDFDGDGSLDYVLFNSTTRRTAIWYLNGNVLATGAFGPTLPAGYTLACVADMNLDSNPDFILFNPATRQTVIWYLNNNVFVNAVFGPTIAAGYILSATADINRDTKPDYILFNTNTRQTAIWYLNGVSLIGSVFGPTLPAGWRLSDALDFNANNNPDYLLTNPTTRQTAIWYLNGPAVASTVLGPTVAAGYTLEGAGDFNLNGKPDYVLFNAGTRQTAIWYLNGAAFSSSAFGPTIAAG